MRRALILLALALTPLPTARPASGMVPPERLVAGVLTIHNPLDRVWPAAPVTLPLAELNEWTRRSQRLVLRREGANLTLPVQIDDRDRDGTPDEVFFFVDLPAGGNARWVAWWVPAEEVPPVTPPLVGARVSEEAAITRLVWESQRQLFCLYGAAKLDLIGKLAMPLLAADWYFGPQPHSPHRFTPGLGMDYVPVGDTMGAGSFGFVEGDAGLTRPWTQNSFRRALLSPEDDARFTFEVVAEGPLRAIVRTRIDGWQGTRGDYAVTVDHIVAAGWRHTLAEVRFDQLPDQRDGLRFAAGFRALPGDQVRQGSGYLCSAAESVFDPAAGHVVARRLGLGLVHPPELAAPLLEGSEANHVAVLDVVDRGAVTLGHVGAWDKDGGLRGPDAWEAAVRALVEETYLPPRVSVDRG